MDPIFGLPCTTDSRAMELARNRNHIANKNLARKFEALDLAQRSRSGKFLTQKSDIQDFLTSIELNPSLTDKTSGKKPSSSMSLQELDKRLREVKGLKMATDALARSRFPNAEDPKMKMSNIYKENSDVSLIGAFDNEGQHIVDIHLQDQLLTINRKKHAMRDAWGRATSTDMQYRSHTSLAQGSYQSHKVKLQDKREASKSAAKPESKAKHGDITGKS